jgi:tetratricopeptide (TPR) repeat protein
MSRSVLRKMERWEEAIASYTRQVEAEGETSRALNNRAFCRARLGQFAEAVLDYSRAFEVDPENAHALHNRGICLQRTGLFAEVPFSHQGYRRLLQTHRTRRNQHRRLLQPRVLPRQSRTN